MFKLIKKDDVFNNVNVKYQIPIDTQKKLINGNAQFIIDLARKLNSGYSIPTLACNIANRFFVTKSYIYHDRFVHLHNQLVCAASLVIAFKLKDIDVRIKILADAFYSIMSQIQNSTAPFTADKMNILKDNICITESLILRTFSYDFDQLTPHQFVRSLCDNWANKNKQKIFYTSKIMILDASRTYAPLCFKQLQIAIACFLAATHSFGIQPYFNEKLNSQFLQREKAYEKWIREIGKMEKRQISIYQIQQVLLAMNQLLFLGNPEI